MNRLCRVAVIVAALVPAVALARDDKKEHPIDDKTAEIMKKLGPVIKDAKSLHCDAAIDTTISDDTNKREFTMRAAIDMQRPNMFRLRSDNTKDKEAGLEVVSDGKNLYVHDRKGKQYTEKAAPAKTDAIGETLQRLGQQNTGMLFQNILSDNPAKTLLDGISEGKHVGMEKVGGKDTHHLAFKQDGNDWDLWVAAEGEALVLKARMSAELPNGMKMVTVETYTNWKRDAEPAKDTFAFKPPEGAQKVDRLGGGRGGAPKAQPKDD